MSDNLIEQPVIPLPDGFTWGFVTARSIHAMADTARDWDRYPEARGSNGRAIFTPRVRFNKHTEDPTAFVQYEVARARIREGTLIDAEGLEGIWLITGDYDVTFQIDDGSIPGFPITVTEEYTQDNPLDLVKYSPIEVPPGYVEIVRIVDRERAESAAEAAEGYAETASGYVDEARQVVQTETFEGFVSDAQSARDQADQHRVSAEESANSASQDANRSEMAYAGVENLLEDLPDTFEDVATRDYVDTSVSGLASESYVNENALSATGYNLSPGTDLNSFVGNQIGYVASASADTIENRPPTAPSSGATILVYTNNSSAIHTQEWIIGIGSGRNRRYIRTRTASQTNWSDWDEFAYMSDVDGLASESYVDDRITEVNTIKGRIPDDTNVDDAFGEEWHGYWFVNGSLGVTGLPKDPIQGSVFEVQWTTGANGTTQFYTDVSDRYWREASLSAGGNSRVTSWGRWHRIASTEEVENAVSGLASESYVDSSVSGLASEDSVVVVTPNLSEGDDLDDFLGNQMSYVGSSNSASIVNRPPDSPSSGATVIAYSGGAGTQNQEWTLNTGSTIGHKWVRSRTANSNGWASWHKLVLEEDLESLRQAVQDLQDRLDYIEHNQYTFRGTLPAGTDLDEVNSIEWNGIWRAGSSDGILGLPFTPAGAYMIEHMYSSTTVAKQVATYHHESWWRESINGSSQRVTNWGDWHRYGDQVG